jgi:hypothetical protein
VGSVYGMKSRRNTIRPSVDGGVNSVTVPVGVAISFPLSFCSSSESQRSKCCDVVVGDIEYKHFGAGGVTTVAAVIAG